MNDAGDVLAQRLRELPLDAPRPGVVSARVLAAAARPAPRRDVRALVLRTAALLAAVPVAWAILYFAPATAAALADAPVAGSTSAGVLRAVGLGTGGSVTAQSSTAINAGYRVQLVGVYADPLRTVVLLKITPAEAAGFQGARLTDQFGISYELRSGVANYSTGDEALVFEPPSALSAGAGMRFSVSLSLVETRSGASVPGHWTVRGLVLPNQGRTLAAPAAGQLGAGTVTFTAARYAGRVLALDADVRGLPPGALAATMPDNGKYRAAFRAELVRGGASIPMDVSLGATGDVSHLQALATDVGPGTYTLVLTLDGSGVLQRTLVVG